MDLSKLRQKVYQLNMERSKLLSRVLRPGKMIQGSLYQMRRGCGNPNCKCAKGQKHTSWYLSQRFEGKTKLKYIGRILPAWLTEMVYRYQYHKKILAKIRKIDNEISNLLNQLLEAMVEPIEKLWEKRR